MKNNMLAILENLISMLLLPVGFALDNFILLLKAPLGFAAVFSSVAFFEYSITKSIVKSVIYPWRQRRHECKAQTIIKVEFMPVLDK